MKNRRPRLGPGKIIYDGTTYKFIPVPQKETPIVKGNGFTITSICCEIISGKTDKNNKVTITDYKTYWTLRLNQ